MKALVLAGLLSTALSAHGAAGIDCARPVGSIESLICQDRELLALDRQLASTYTQARKVARKQRPNLLPAEQRGWIKGRNDCWKADDRRQCTLDSMRRRIVELEAGYRLRPALKTVRYVCNGNPADEIVVTFFATEPPSLIAERGDSVSLMLAQPAASGARYEGGNEMLWEHHGEAIVRWGHGAGEMVCRTDPVSATPDLTGTHWVLRAMHSMDDSQGTTQVAAPDRYSLNFAADGRAALRLDCNRGSANWQADDNGRLTFGAIASTRAMCPADSLADRLAAQLPHVRSYTRHGDRLHMALQADGGILEWQRRP